MAAQLCAYILSQPMEMYTPGITHKYRHAAGQMVSTIACKPLEFAAPRPQKPRKYYEAIYNWVDDVPVVQISCRSDEDEVSCLPY